MSYIIPVKSFLVELQHQDKIACFFVNINLTNPKVKLLKDEAIQLAKEAGEKKFGHSNLTLKSVKEIESSTESGLVFYEYTKPSKPHFDSQHLKSDHVHFEGSK